MDPTDKSGRIAGWLMGLAMKLPGARGALRRLLLRDDATLFEPDPGCLLEILARDNHARLKALGSDEQYVLFRALAQASDRAPLKALLFEDGHAALKDLLARRSHEALKAVMFDGDPEWFSMIVRSRHGEPLADLLFAEDAALLRHAIRLRGAAALLPVLESLGAADRVILARAMLFAGRPGALELLSRMPGFQDEVIPSPRLRAMAALWETWEGLRPLFPAEDLALETRLREAAASIAHPDQVRGRILDAIAEGDLVRLAQGALRFPCRHSLWTLVHEILLNEDYYFECASEAPVIVDGGAHMGMAIYYFKLRYPGARITAFEPHPNLRALARENVARNGWDDVEVLPYALAGTRGEATFHISETWSMAGSLLERRSHLGDEVTAITVPCVPLSDYLRGPVDFLKLDIEGAEGEVLEEAAPWLHNAGCIFCEFHQGGGLSSGRLARILALLETADFDVQVAKSRSYQETSRSRPFTHFDGAASTLIWARNRRGGGTDANGSHKTFEG